MAEKKIILVSPTNKSRTIEWDKCYICQKSTSEKLSCPAAFAETQPGIKRKYDAEQEYSKIANSIEEFQNLGQMPIKLDVTSLDDGEGIAKTLLSRKANHHRSCQIKFKPVRLTQAKKRSLDKDDDDKDQPNKKRLTRKDLLSDSQTASTTNKGKCYFCERSDGKLHLVTSFRLDRRVRRCAAIIGDTEGVLVGKLSSNGDMIAQDAMYHAKCLVDLYRRADNIQLGGVYNDDEKRKHGVAFSAVVSVIEDDIAFLNSLSSDEDVHIFRLSDLVKVYTNRLRELGVEVTGRIHSTRLKNRILSQFEDLRACNQGKEVYLVYDDDIGEALKAACNVRYDDEAFILVQAAQIVRREMFQKAHDGFKGSFDTDCQTSFVSSGLSELITMILQGHSSKPANPYLAQAVLSVCQIIEFNSRVKTRDNSTSNYHNSKREPPLAVYIGLLVHSMTRSRKLIDKLYAIGLSIHYDRVLELSTAMGNSIISQYEIEKVVCPSIMRNLVFTSSAIDNLDHDPSSNTATSSFHGTGISLFQHLSDGKTGVKRKSVFTEGNPKGAKIKPLPFSYTNIKPALLSNNVKILEPECLSDIKEREIEVPEVLDSELKLDDKWLNHVKECIDKESEDDISWSAFHANMTGEIKSHPDITAMLPLFREDSKSPAMIKHALDVIWNAVSYLNPGQPVVVALDQPLYAIAKKIQWQWPEEYGIHRFVIVMGGLHVEMTLLNTLGDWLEDSGWIKALVNSAVATAGVAESFLYGKKVSKTRYAHQVTVAALDILRNKAYNESAPSEDIEMWCEKKEADDPQFKFWYTTLKLELILLRFVRSLRSGNFDLYLHSLNEIMPWLFAFDHTNYSRWLPVHLHDMLSLQQTNPAIYEAFKAGCFTVGKTLRKFSSLPIDHAHEQNNKTVKGSGGAIGLTEDSSELTRWMISGPETARIVEEFERSLPAFTDVSADITKHHEQTASIQHRFKKHVISLVEAIESFGNPFSMDSKELIALDTKDIMDKLVVTTVQTAKSIGERQFACYKEERLINFLKPIDDTISKNNLPTFSARPIRKASKKNEVTDLKRNVKMFSQLYIANQRRNGDLEEFFRHENSSVPPSLSKDGIMRPCDNKSDLLKCLEPLADVTDCKPKIEGHIIEGSVMVHKKRPSGFVKTFGQYAEEVVIPHLSNALKDVNRLDVVWDVYINNSLKQTTRENRGTGIRKKVQSSVPMPARWDNFLRVNENKTELYHHIAEAIQSTLLNNIENKQVVTTYDDKVICSDSVSVEGISPCNHEEGDYRVMLHAKHMASTGIKTVMISTSDTDVVVISIAMFKQLQLDELWIEFSAGKHVRYIPIHQIVENLGENRSKGMLFFHAFTGCDQVSSFTGIGKKTAWKTWENSPAVTDTFVQLASQPDKEIIESNINQLERFTCLMYCSTTSSTEVNKCRRELFVKKGRPMENLPPSSAALRQHILRAVYQSGYVWSQCLAAISALPSPIDWGWRQLPSGHYTPIWSTLEELSKSCRELKKCRCKVALGCGVRCTCAIEGLPCTEMCICNGDCERSNDIY